MIAFFVFLFLAQLLKPEDFGLVALAGVFIQFTMVFVTFGFSTAIVQRHSLDTEHLDTAFWVNLGISIIVIFLTIVSAEKIATLFGEPKLAPIIIWLSLSFLFSALIPVALGYYNIAYRLITLISNLLVGIMERVIMPAFSRLQKEPKRLQRAFYNVIQIVSLISFPTFFAISLLSPELVVTLFGEKWTPSIPVVQTLALAGILQSVLRIHAVIIICLGKPNWRLALQILEAVSNVIGFLIAVRWGIVAVAISYTVVNFFMFPVWVWITNQLIEINLNAYFRQYLPAITGSFMMVICILFLKEFLSQEFGYSLVLAACTAGGTSLYLLIIYPLFLSLMIKVFNIGKDFLPKIGSKA